MGVEHSAKEGDPGTIFFFRICLMRAKTGPKIFLILYIRIEPEKELLCSGM